MSILFIFAPAVLIAAIAERPKKVNHRKRNNLIQIERYI